MKALKIITILVVALFLKSSPILCQIAVLQLECVDCEAQVNSSASLPGQPTMKNPSHPIQKCVVTQLLEIVSTFLFTTRFFFQYEMIINSCLPFLVSMLQTCNFPTRQNDIIYSPTFFWVVSLCSCSEKKHCY